jgi:hypothetical protein
VFDIPPSTLFSLLVSLVVGGVLIYSDFQVWRATYFPASDRQDKYSDRLRELTANLTRASREVDAILFEMTQVARSRELAVSALDNQLTEMEMKERELQSRIVELEQVPLPVADHFAKLLETEEKKSARRDYLLFGSGVVVSMVVEIIIRFLLG